MSCVEMLPFTLRQIEAFLVLCDKGSFREAADELGISQPAISRLIKSLEAQLGFDLFDRRPGYSARLSVQGARFRDQARDFQKSGKNLGASRKAQADDRLIKLRTYVGGHIMSEYLRQQMPLFYERHPKVVFDFIETASRDEMIERIRRGKVDFAVFAIADQITLDGEIIGYDEAGIVASPGAYSGPLDPKVISALPFVLPPEGTADEKLLLDAMAKGAIVPTNIYARAPYSENRLALAATGKCITHSTASVSGSFPQYKLEVIHPMPRWTRWLYISPKLNADIAKSLRAIVIESLSA